MRNIVVVGSKWGEEGKGKIVDWLAKQGDVDGVVTGEQNDEKTLVMCVVP